MSLTKVTYSMIAGESANVLDFGADATGNTDSTSAFNSAIATGKSVWVPNGTYAVSGVTIGLSGADIICDANVTFTVASGTGFIRNIPQVTYATFIANNQKLDGINYYYTFKFTGGKFVVEDGATALSERMPSLAQYSCRLPGIVWNGIDVFLKGNTSVAFGVHGNWNNQIIECQVCGDTPDGGQPTTAVALYIAPDGTYSASSQPQILTVDRCHFNFCAAIVSDKGTCNNSVEELRIINGSFTNNSNSTLDTVYVVHWDNNQWITQNNRINFYGCTAVDITNSIFTAYNTADTNYGHLLFAEYAQKIHISDCFFHMSGYTTTDYQRNGISFDASLGWVLDVSIVNNSFYKDRKNSATANKSSCVRFATVAGGNIISGVVIRNNKAQNVHYIINFSDVDNGNPIDNIVIEDLINLEIGTETCDKFINDVSANKVTNYMMDQYWKNISIDMGGCSNDQASSQDCMRMTLAYVPTYSTPTVTRTAYTNVYNADATDGLRFVSYNNGNYVFALKQANLVGTGKYVLAAASFVIDATVC